MCSIARTPTVRMRPPDSGGTASPAGWSPLRPSGYPPVARGGVNPPLAARLEPQLVEAVERGRLVALGQGRVVEHRVHEVVDGPPEGHHRLADVQELGGTLADDVDAEE